MNKYSFMHANTIGGKLSALDFSTASKGVSSKQLGFKKSTTINNVLDAAQDANSDRSRDVSKYIILPEYRKELIYQELLPKLEAYNQTLSMMMSLWREHAAFLNNFSECIHLFHVPEVHDAMVQTLFRHIHGGNTALRHASCKCLVNILIHQHDFAREQALVTLINQDLATSNAF